MCALLREVLSGMHEVRVLGRCLRRQADVLRLPTPPPAPLRLPTLRRARNRMRDVVRAERKGPVLRWQLCCRLHQVPVSILARPLQRELHREDGEV